MKARKGIGYIVIFNGFTNCLWLHKYTMGNILKIERLLKSKPSLNIWECDFIGAKDLLKKAYYGGAYISKSKDVLT